MPIIIDILAVSQEFYQGLNSTDSPFLQLPYMTRNIISKLDLQNTSFKDYISLPPEKRNLSLAFNEQQIEIIESSISQLPKLSIEIESSIKSIKERNLIMVRIQGKIIRSSTIKNSKLPFLAHSNCFPQLKEETLWLVICDGKSNAQYNSIKLNKCTSTFAKRLFSFAPKVFYR